MIEFLVQITIMGSFLKGNHFSVSKTMLIELYLTDFYFFPRSELKRSLPATFHFQIVDISRNL